MRAWGYAPTRATRTAIKQDDFWMSHTDQSRHARETIWQEECLKDSPPPFQAGIFVFKL
jgi:hypothetical protein